MWRKHLATHSDWAQHKSPSKEETFSGSSTLRKLQWNSRFRWSLMQILTFYLLFRPYYSSGAEKRYTIFSHARAIIALECRQGDDSVLDNKKKNGDERKGQWEKEKSFILLRVRPSFVGYGAQNRWVSRHARIGKMYFLKNYSPALTSLSHPRPTLSTPRDARTIPPTTQSIPRLKDDPSARESSFYPPR